MSEELETLLDKIDDACTRHGMSEDETNEFLALVHRSIRDKDVRPESYLAFLRGLYGEEMLH